MVKGGLVSRVFSPEYEFVPVDQVKLGRFWRFFRWVLVVVPCLFVVWFMVMCNLWSNSVYYAMHTPNSKVFVPEVVMLLENLEYMNRPEINNIRYVTKGNNGLTNCIIKEIKCGHVHQRSEYGIFYNSPNGSYYFLTKEFNPTNDILNVHITPSDRNKLKSEVYRTVDPVLKVNRNEPDVNLQWLFDWYYYDVFN